MENKPFHKYRSVWEDAELMERLRRIRHVALDMDGTIYMGMSLFPYTQAFLRGLREQGIRPWMCLAYGNPVYGAQKSLGSRIFTDEERHFKALRLGVLAEAAVHEANVRLALEHSFNNRLETVKLHKLHGRHINTGLRDLLHHDHMAGFLSLIHISEPTRP